MMKNGMNVPDQSTYTTSFAVNDINVSSTDPSAQTMGILKDIKLSVTTSTDKKANKSEAKFNVTSTNNLLPISMDLDFRMFLHLCCFAVPGPRLGTTTSFTNWRPDQ